MTVACAQSFFPHAQQLETDSSPPLPPHCTTQNSGEYIGAWEMRRSDWIDTPPGLVIRRRYREENSRARLNGILGS